MKPIFAYRAISNTLFLFGFQGFDFFVVFVAPAVVASFNVKLGIIALILVFWFFKRFKLRHKHYFKSVFIFFTIPRFLSVSPYYDIPSYRSVLNGDNTNNP